MSEFDEYKIASEPDKKGKSEIWETAIGLQKVDGLKPSKYLIETARAHIEGDITIHQVKEQISTYYMESLAVASNNREELEADVVSARIAEILAERGFSLNYVEFVGIHRRLFEGLYDFAGTIRTYNIEKKEWVLNGKSVTYGNHANIKDYIEYDLNVERNFSYKGLSKYETLNHIADFASRLWQVHAFGEGNTRTVAVFLIKYLRQLGFNIDNTLFADNSWYFRNSLVRANYDDYSNNIYATNEFLIKFLENLLFGGKNILQNRYLNISNDTVNDTVNRQDDTVFSLIQKNNNITTLEIAEKLGKSISTIKRKIKELKDNGIIERIGSDKAGSWKILNKDN